MKTSSGKQTVTTMINPKIRRLNYVTHEAQTMFTLIAFRLFQ